MAKTAPKKPSPKAPAKAEPAPKKADKAKEKALAKPAKAAKARSESDDDDDDDFDADGDDAPPPAMVSPVPAKKPFGKPAGRKGHSAPRRQPSNFDGDDSMPGFIDEDHDSDFGDEEELATAQGAPQPAETAAEPGEGEPSGVTSRSTRTA